MATGRTVNASYLSDRDKKVFDLVEKIAIIMNESIKDDNKKRDFIKNYSKISRTRDAGTGQGGGKLQRDALTTRGRQGKAPYSNRNLRWNPLILANKVPKYAKHIDRIEIEGGKIFKFIIKGKSYYPEQVYELNEVYASIPDDYSGFVDIIKNFNDTNWTDNSCLIPAYEYAPWNLSVQTFITLGLIVLKGIYFVSDFSFLDKIRDTLKQQSIDKNVDLLNREFNGLLDDIDNLVKCPLCLAPISAPPANISQSGHREEVFQAPWKHSKRDEGEAESLQLLHTMPLIEAEIRHIPSYVRYGHRWCNISMTDHSVDETVDFMSKVVEAHKKYTHK